MKLSTAQEIIESARDMGFDEEDCYLYEKYSGRFMFGQATTGIVVSSNCPIEDLIGGSANHFRRDNLGYDTIYY